MKRMILVDGLNVVRHNPSLKKMETEQGTDAVIEKFFRLAKDVISPHDHWIIVFDGFGDPKSYKDEKEEKQLDIVFAKDITADEVIIDRARYALDLGDEIIVATSDQELVDHVEGAEILSAFEIYDVLMTRLTDEVVQTTTVIKPKEIVDYLDEKHFLAPRFRLTKDVVRQIRDILEYYRDELPDKANKAATRIDGALRELNALIPNPDPEKQVIRAIKKYLQSF